jgi:hypothetical protein
MAVAGKTDEFEKRRNVENRTRKSVTMPGMTPFFVFILSPLSLCDDLRGAGRWDVLYAGVIRPRMDAIVESQFIDALLHPPETASFTDAFVNNCTTGKHLEPTG